MVNKQSGLLGLSGVSSDMREINEAIASGNEKALLARSVYFYRLKKYIGAYAAAMGGVDAIVFTGGVGENSDICRAAACKGLEFMGVELDQAKNLACRGTEVISTDNSKVTVVVIPTDEEYMIALDTKTLLNL
jgi:acetate kinase